MGLAVPHFLYIHNSPLHRRAYIRDPENRCVELRLYGRMQVCPDTSRPVQPPNYKNHLGHLCILELVIVMTVVMTVAVFGKILVERPIYLLRWATSTTTLRLPGYYPAITQYPTIQDHRTVYNDYVMRRIVLGIAAQSSRNYHR